MEKTNPRIIVIGAGMAGVKASFDLSKQGYEIILLEGSDRVGGRMRSEQFCGHTIELGSNWITGLEGDDCTNPVYTLA